MGSIHASTLNVSDFVFAKEVSVLILLDMCPHTARSVSSYSYKSVHTSRNSVHISKKSVHISRLLLLGLR